MDKRFKPKEWEEKLYKSWEAEGLFTAKVDKKKKPFVIILPPPNANGNLHMGHAMMVYQDIMVRYNKLLGKEVLYLPGADHAGFETWYVFEKELQKQGKSRFDFKREELYKMVWEFTMKYRGRMEDQLRRLGFALDWEKKKFTLDEDIVWIVYLTFKKLFDEGLVYRAKRLINYCVRCKTSFSDLEVSYEEEEGRLWYIKYPLKGEEGFITVATTRPETMLGDTAVAVNPKDKRYKNLIGKKVILPLVGREIPIIADEAVDPEFGTGAVKVTPAHDETDWQIAQRHNLPMVQVIGFDGRMTKEAGKFAGLRVKEVREKVLEKLKSQGFLEKVKKHVHRVGKCYKCKTPIEPLPREQWFIKIRPLAEKAKELVKKGKIKIIPKKFEKILLDWLDRFYDWNISRQIIWGIRIPAYKCQMSNVKCQNCERKAKSEKVKGDGWFVSLERPEKCPICGECEPKQDEDTFDTWFSSGQWPYATLMSLAAKGEKLKSLEDYQKIEFFKYFYPTSVMETGYDILPWWVARMIMLGNFATGKEPFKVVFLHGLVRDKHGQKMSKSKGNVVNPLDLIEKYGADALRASLVYNTTVGSDVNFSEERIIGMRNFANKIWNMGRFLYLAREKASENKGLLEKEAEELEKEFAEVKGKYFKYMNSYQFPYALELLHEFSWHRFADYYIEKFKEALWQGDKGAFEALQKVYFEILKMLHPFMPFVTEAIWRVFKGEERSILEVSLLSL